MLDLEVLQKTNNSPTTYGKGPSGNKKVGVIKGPVKRIKHMKGGKYINLQYSIYNQVLSRNRIYPADSQ